MPIVFENHLGQTFQLTGDVDETDSPHKVPRHLNSVIEKASHGLHTNDKHLQKKLRRWIEENPNVPQLKNYLMMHYGLKGQQEKAFAYNHEISAAHPDYLFARINLAAEFIHHNDLEKVPEILGPNLNLAELYPNRKTFHVSEYSNFYKLVGEYWCKMKAPDKGLPVLRDLKQIEEEFNTDLKTEMLENDLIRAGAVHLQESMKAAERPVIVKTIPTLPQIKEPPAFHHAQIQWLYENNHSFAPGKLSEILQLERQSLVSDLCSVVEDAVRRYAFFSEQANYDSKTHDFPIHALYLLMELRAEESLQTVLEFLRQPEEVLEYWLGDLITEDIWQVLYDLGKNKLPELEAFLKEPENYTFARSAVSEAIDQLGLHEPERRDEIIGLYRRMLQFLYENKDNPAVFDFTLTSIIIGDIGDLNGIELENDIKRFYDEDLVDTFVEGNWKDAQQELRIPDDQREFSRKSERKSIFQLLDSIRRFENDVIDESEYNDDGFADEYEFVSPPNQPYKREEVKIGRNDPCPCGSGMKYKKCHGKSS